MPGSTLKLVERVVKLEEPIKEMFQQEFRNRTTVNQPTPLEKMSCLMRTSMVFAI